MLNKLWGRRQKDLSATALRLCWPAYVEPGVHCIASRSREADIQRAIDHTMATSADKRVFIVGPGFIGWNVVGKSSPACSPRVS